MLDCWPTHLNDCWRSRRSRMQKRTSIPVSRVLAWSSNNSNVVGAEHIINLPVFLSFKFGLQSIRNLTQVEAQLSSIRFPAYGGLATEQARLMMYLILLSVLDLLVIEIIALIQVWTSIKGFVFNSPWGFCCKARNATNIRERTARSNSLLLRKYRRTNSTPKSNRDCHGTVRLEQNIESGSFPAYSMTQFLFSCILQAQWAVFLKPPQNYGYEKGIFEVKRRDDFDTLDEVGKKLAIREWSQVKLAKAYEISTLLEDKPVHRVMNLFLRCGEVSEIGVLPLRACLIELFQNWSDLGFSGEYALSFTQEQIDMHDRQFSEYQAGIIFRLSRKNALTLMWKDGSHRDWMRMREGRRMSNCRLFTLKALLGKNPQKWREPYGLFRSRQEYDLNIYYAGLTDE
ncbi:hypothetical protein N7450_011655 [Penicillium hetheringtonii]|uniref:Uncharacterized protein n=1 Tax=Penicillium hetheringtonii TaxID=911720 RepID=A0AAD6DAB1_9EURO|nr:hypothetical protein N7450_011655 [Penicillium hetheringtonii]